MAAVAQTAPKANPAPPQTAASTHGLALILSRDAPPNPDQGGHRPTCPANQPPLACTPLTLTLKNEGNETIVSWGVNCGHRYTRFESLRPDGAWQPFPTNNLLVCDKNVLVLQIIAPGESSTLHLTLADPGWELDTARPPDDDQLHASQGFEFLTGKAPHTIRARWNIHGCAAAGHPTQSDVHGPTAWFSLCAEGSERGPQFAVLESNELQLD
jgi:hypothetical protein